MDNTYTYSNKRDIIISDNESDEGIIAQDMQSNIFVFLCNKIFSVLQFRSVLATLFSECPTKSQYVNTMGEKEIYLNNIYLPEELFLRPLYIELKPVEGLLCTLI